jgi:hypothetical protein
LGNTLATIQAYPAPTPQIAKSLSPQGLQDHRRQIASEVKTVLSAYFQPHEADEIKAAQLAWWCDELQDWTQEQVVWALRTWNRANPRLRPTPGDIVGIMIETRGKREAAKMAAIAPPPEQPRERVSPERAAEIWEEFGMPSFTPKPFPATGDGAE